VSAVCGFDLSSKAVDIVCLDAESNRAEWLRVELVAASLPARLRTPERCWVVRPDEYRTGLGLKGKPGYKDVGLLSGGEFWNDDQNARDAYALAMWARDTNAKAVAA
jgi:hypothetical protein